MKPDEIRWNDWLRIALGEVPVEFYFELLIRGAFVYLLLLASMRALGKRMAGQLSRIDLTAMVALASSIGVSILSPVNGLLPPLIIAIIIVSVTKLIYWLSTRNEKFETMSQGDLDTLVQDGVMYLGRMKKVRLTRERLFAQLRSYQVPHLGKVSRMYMEADGKFSILLNDGATPGLLVLPEWDEEFVSSETRSTDIIICRNCGVKRSQDPANEMPCEKCGSKKSTQAVLEKESEL